MKHLLLRAAVPALALLLTACSGLLPKPAPLDIYRLPVAAPIATRDAPAQAGLKLQMDAFQANGILAGSRIAVVPSDNRISVYHGARWAQPVPRLLRERLIEAFRNAGGQQVVFNESAGLSADYIVSGSLTAFQAEYHDADVPVVVITLHAVLRHAGSGEVVANRRFHVEVAADATDVPSVVDSFSSACDELSHMLVPWVYTQIEQATGGS